MRKHSANPEVGPSGGVAGLAEPGLGGSHLELTGERFSANAQQHLGWASGGGCPIESSPTPASRPRRTRGEKDDQPHASRHHTRRAGPVRPDHDTTVADRRNGPLRAHTGSDRCRGRCRHRPRRHGLHPPRRVLRQVQRGALPRGRLRPALRSLHRRDRTARDRTVSVSLLRPWAGRLPSSR